MSTPPPLQQFLSEQLAEACRCIIAEYERVYAVTDSSACRPPTAKALDDGERMNTDQAGRVEPGISTTGSSWEPEARPEVPASSPSSALRLDPPKEREPHTLRGLRTLIEDASEAFSTFHAGQGQVPVNQPGKFISHFTEFESAVSEGRRGEDLTNDVATPMEKCVINPNATVYLVWLRFVEITTVCSTFFTPVKYAFGDLGKSGDIADLTIDIIFASSILLSFTVAFKIPGGLIWNRCEIAKRIASSGGFWTDVLAAIPFGKLASLAGANDSIANVFSLLRLLRVHRLMRMFREMQASAKTNLVFVVMAKFLTFILLWTHVAGCVLYALARVNDFDADTWVYRVDPDLPKMPWYTRYSHMLFWAVGTFKAGPAHGNLAPNTAAEMSWSIVAMLLNICLQTYLVSSMAALLTTADMRIYAMRNKLSQLAQFSKRHHLSQHLLWQVQEYTIFKFSMNQELDESVMGALPEIYRQRISQALYNNLLESLSLLYGCNRQFLNQLHGALEASWHMVGHDLIKEQDGSGELLILVEGTVVVTYQAEEVDVLHDGEALTAVPFICQTAQQFGMKTRKQCRILSLRRMPWEVACRAHPEDVTRVKGNMLTNCKARMRECSPDSPSFRAYESLMNIVLLHLSQQKEEATGALCYAAGAGDLEKIKSICRTHPAACGDYDMRTPLHIAAAKDQVSALGVLLEAGADINAVDNFGRTPLMEAVRSKREAAADVLFSWGGSLGFDLPRIVSTSLPVIINSSSFSPYASPYASPTKSYRASPHASPTKSYRAMSNGPPGSADSATCSDSEARRLSSHSVLGNGQQPPTSAATELCEAASDPLELWTLGALIKYGADVNAHDYDARTALHVASASGNKGAIKLLLEQPGINVSPTDNFGRTPLMEAVRHKHEPCARLLKAHGATHGFAICAMGSDANKSIDANVLYAGQELCQAAFANDTSYLHGLVKLCNMDVDSPDYDLRTALMLSCAEGHSDAAMSLVQLGADMYKKDRWGHTAVDEAKDHGHHSLAELLENFHQQRRIRSRTSTREKRSAS